MYHSASNVETGIAWDPKFIKVLFFTANVFYTKKFKYVNAQRLAAFTQFYPRALKTSYDILAVP